MCWDETEAAAETVGGDGELVPLFERAKSMREAYEDYLEKEEGAMAAWEWREMEHEIWAARFAEANMFRDTGTPPSIWSDDDRDGPRQNGDCSRRKRALQRSAGNPRNRCY